MKMMALVIGGGETEGQTTPYTFYQCETMILPVSIHERWKINIFNIQYK
jgi:hypothetical protein